MDGVAGRPMPEIQTACCLNGFPSVLIVHRIESDLPEWYIPVFRRKRFCKARKDAIVNKIGVHGFVWTGDWEEKSIEHAVNITAGIGYDILEIPALDPTALRIDFTRRQLEQAGVRATLSLGLDRDTDISSGEFEKTRRGEERLMQAVAAARDLGSSHVCGILYSALGKYFAPPTKDGIDRAMDVLRRVCEEARKSNVTIGLEVVNRYESNVLNTGAQAVEMCKCIGAPNVKVHLDTYHMNIEEADFEHAIIEVGDYLGYVHVGESHRGYLGSGSIDFPSIFRGLAKVNYEGPVTFESFSSTITGQPLSGTLAIWRNLWDDGEDLARHALDFIRTELKSAGEAVSVRAGFDL